MKGTCSGFAGQRSQRGLAYAEGQQDSDHHDDRHLPKNRIEAGFSHASPHQRMICQMANANTSRPITKKIIAMTLSDEYFILASPVFHQNH